MVTFFSPWKKVNGFSMSMKKINSGLVVRYFEKNQLKDKYVTKENGRSFNNLIAFYDST